MGNHKSLRWLHTCFSTQIHLVKNAKWQIPNINKTLSQKYSQSVSLSPSLSCSSSLSLSFSSSYRFLQAYLGDTYQSIAAHSLYRHMLDWHKHKYNWKIRTPVQRQEQVDRSSNLLVASLHLVSSHDLLALGFCDLFSNTFARYMLDSLHVLCAFPNSDDMETADEIPPYLSLRKTNDTSANWHLCRSPSKQIANFSIRWSKSSET